MLTKPQPQWLPFCTSQTPGSFCLGLPLSFLEWLPLHVSRHSNSTSFENFLWLPNPGIRHQSLWCPTRHQSLSGTPPSLFSSHHTAPCDNISLMYSLLNICHRDQTVSLQSLSRTFVPFLYPVTSLLLMVSDVGVFQSLLVKWQIGELDTFLRIMPPIKGHSRNPNFHFYWVNPTLEKGCKKDWLASARKASRSPMEDTRILSLVLGFLELIRQFQPSIDVFLIENRIRFWSLILPIAMPLITDCVT